MIILKYMEISNYCIVHQKQTQYYRSILFQNKWNKQIGRKRSDLCLPEANGCGRGNWMKVQTSSYEINKY